MHALVIPQDSFDGKIAEVMVKYLQSASTLFLGNAAALGHEGQATARPGAD